MAARKTDTSNDATTELKIRQAARTIFHKKGYAATRTRDIAEAAGINLALLNYYFRSKERLFEIIMLETLQGFLESMTLVFNDENSSLQAKIEIIVSRYIDLLTVEPQVPLFIMSELRTHPQTLLKKTRLVQIVKNSVFVRQYQQAVKDGSIAGHHLLHFVMNLMGLTVFPFVASPLLKNLGNINDEQFNRLMKERKTLVPGWMKLTMKP